MARSHNVPRATVRTMAFSLRELKAMGGSGAEHHSVCCAENLLKVDKRKTWSTARRLLQ